MLKLKLEAYFVELGRAFMSLAVVGTQDWDPQYGDRMQKIVFIGQNLDKKALEQLMDSCLAE